MKMNKENIINLVETIGKLSKENTNLYGILIDIMKELSLIYPKHEIETLPAKVKEVVQRLIEVENEKKSLEEKLKNACTFEIKIIDNIYCYKTNKKSHINEGYKCSACGISQWEVLEYSKHHTAIL